MFVKIHIHIHLNGNTLFEKNHHTQIVIYYFYIFGSVALFKWEADNLLSRQSYVKHLSISKICISFAPFISNLSFSHSLQIKHKGIARLHLFVFTKLPPLPLGVAILCEFDPRVYNPTLCKIYFYNPHNKKNKYVALFITLSCPNYSTYAHETLPTCSHGYGEGHGIPFTSFRKNELINKNQFLWLGWATYHVTRCQAPAHGWFTNSWPFRPLITQWINQPWSTSLQNFPVTM